MPLSFVSWMRQTSISCLFKNSSSSSSLCLIPQAFHWTMDRPFFLMVWFCDSVASSKCGLGVVSSLSFCLMALHELQNHLINPSAAASWSSLEGKESLQHYLWNKALHSEHLIAHFLRFSLHLAHGVPFSMMMGSEGGGMSSSSLWSMQVQVLVFEPCLILLHFVPLCVSLEQPTTWHLMGLWLFANSFLHTAQGRP